MISKPYRKILLIGLLLLSACSVDKADQFISINGNTMGTTYSLQLDAVPDGITEDELKNQLEDILATINQQMSTFDPDSEISQFNQSQSIDWFPVSSELVFLTSIAKGHSLLSGGAFDITVGPLVELWGCAQLGNQTPENDAIQTVQQLLEWRSQPA